MRLTIEIVAGKSIGPFQLGMTFEEIDKALRSFSSEPVTLAEIGIVAWCSTKKGEPEASDRCDKLGIRVYNNLHTVLLRNQAVNNISNENAIRLFESFAGVLEHSYGGFLAPQFGIDAVRWENSDPWIDSIFVIACETRTS